MKKSALCSAFFGILLTGIGQSATLAYWNFNGLSIPTAAAPGSGGVPTSIAPSSSTVGGSVVLTGFSGTVDDFAGSTINVVSPDPAGVSLSLVASGTAPFPGNGTYIEIQTLNLTGASDIGVTYATRGTSTGFNSGVWSYSISGGAFTAVPGNFASTSTTFSLASVDLRSVTALNGASAVTLRYTLDGASSSSGNNRIDNLQVVSNFVPVPETSPAALGLFTAAALLRRRRC